MESNQMVSELMFSWKSYEFLYSIVYIFIKETQIVYAKNKSISIKKTPIQNKRLIGHIAHLSIDSHTCMSFVKSYTKYLDNVVV